QPYHITKGTPTVINDKLEVLLVTGIANPAPLKKWLSDKAGSFYELAYSDHHIFTIDDLNYMIRRYNQIAEPNKIILTTEKDAVRLIKFRQELEDCPFYVLPIEPRFLFNEQPHFTDLIIKFITNFKPPDQAGGETQ
ncbi:MAG TPA: tetraacyldisaccharide 4'-kinase, partial [Puia sp.]